MRTTMLKRVLCTLTAAILLLSLCSAAFAVENIATKPFFQTASDLTLSDLQALNDGQLEYTTNAEGYITFLKGNYFDGLIQDIDSVQQALIGIGPLLGAEEGTGFVLHNRIRDDNDYLYYTFRQWQSDTAVGNAIVKLIVDPDGKGVAVSSSVIHGIPAETDSFISAEEAVKVVKDTLANNQPDTKFVFYEDNVDKAIAQMLDENEASYTQLAYAVYTNNPSASVANNDLPYLAHYVGATGDYLYSMPVSSRGNSYAMQGTSAELVFEGMTAAEYTGTVTTSSGETRELTVPVMFEESTGTYYLGDLKRMMVVADCWEFSYNDANVVIASSADNTGWDDSALIAYDNYIQAYDFYNEAGWTSTDGLGTPILLLTDYVNEQREPLNNACYMGNMHGWQTFAVTSQLNDYNEALDIIGHEFTHGVTVASMTSLVYENQYGAINEAMSDIMGNLMEMLTGSTDDTTWLMGENGGAPLRCMTDPNSFAQPAYVGDVYYAPDAVRPSAANDRGGVHLNNALLAGVAPKLFNAGMTLEEQRTLWTTFICMLTPRSTYQDVCGMLPLAATLSGLDKHQDIISQALTEIGLDNDDPFGTLREGCGIVTMNAVGDVYSTPQRMQILMPTGVSFVTYPSAEGQTIAMLKEGSYIIAYVVYADESLRDRALYYYDGDGWTLDKTQKADVEIKAGETFAMPDLKP